MNFVRRQFLKLAVPVLAALFPSGQGAWSQTARVIKIVVPAGPGNGSDILARLLTEQIGRAQGITAVVENRPGAANIIAIEAVAGAAPDGNTLLMVGNPFVFNSLVRKLNYDPLTRFEPVCLLVNTPQLIVVNNTSPYHTLAELLDAARAKPSALTLASFGPASTLHLAFEQLKRAANVDMIYVPYPAGTAPAVHALLGKHVTAVMGGFTELADQVKAGELRALATGARSRIESLPDVPTIAESGYKDFEIDVWFGAVVPAKTPKETVSQLAGWFTAAMKAPEVNAKLDALALHPIGVCGADFGAFLRNQYEDYGRMIRETKIKVE